MRIARLVAVSCAGLISACSGLESTVIDRSTGSFNQMAMRPGAPPLRPGLPPAPTVTPRPVATPSPAPALPAAPTPTPLPAHDPVALPGDEVSLGRALFFDKALSRDGTVSCASCHDPARGFADGRPVGVGVDGAHGKRNVPTIVNAGRQPFQFWDGRAATLADQALGPIQAADEMAMTLPALTARLQGTATYARAFQTVYASNVTPALVARAIARWEQTVQAPNDSLAARVLRREPAALAQLSASQRAGEGLFRNRGCVSCHGGQDGRDNRFNNIGVGMDKAAPDLGRFAVTGLPADYGAFKTPTLVNVADTAPYMHDGSQATLRDVVEHYNRGGIRNQNLDRRIQPLNLNEQQKQDLVAFLSIFRVTAPAGTTAP